MNAVRENRVLTVIQRHKNAKDFGLIGFHPQPLATYFIFPKPLPPDSDSRVIGIKYDLLNDPETKQPSAPVKPKIKKREKKFKVVVERTATTELDRTLSRLIKIPPSRKR